jgi:hypothetical protein
MPRMSRNELIDKYTKGVCINLTFSDYYHLKKHMKGKPLKLKTGKVLPAPNALMTALAAKATGDFVLESENVVFQHFLFANEKDAAAFIKMFPGESPRTSLPAGCSRAHNAYVSEKTFVKLAETLGLI